MSTGAAYLAEVSTAAASGETARIYQAIRRCTAGPLVALIYRHLATMPGVLEAVWQAVEPLLESGELQTRAWALAEGAWDGPLPDASAPLRALDRTALADCARVIDAYNRANPVNYAVVSVIHAAQPVGGAAQVAAGAGGPAAVAAGAPPWTPPEPIGSIAPIPAIEALDPQARAIVERFGKDAGTGAPLLMPTLYRHIAHWPGLLEFAGQEVAPRLADGSFEPAIQGFRERLASAAGDLAVRHAIRVDPALHTPAMTALLERFTAVIPEMVVVGQFLRRAIARA